MIENSRLRDFQAAINGQPIGVLGVGISNRPLIAFLHQLGARITAFDALPIDDPVLSQTKAFFDDKGVDIIWSTGKGYLDALSENHYAMLFRTPMMRPDLPELLAAREKGTVLTSEMDLFVSLCPSKIFAVTGSDGKTTTTTLIYQLLQTAGHKVWLGGNIGTPLLDRVDQMKDTDMVVLELSSFQLMTLSISPDVAVVTNISKNHLDFHKDYDEYIQSKQRIYQNQPCWGRLVLNADCEITSNMRTDARATVVLFSKQADKDVLPMCEQVFLSGDYICLRHQNRLSKLIRRDEIKLIGMHNAENYMAAIGATLPFVETDAIVEVAQTFTGVKHRIELVRTLNGVRYYNSSIDTSPNRTIHTMKALAEHNEHGVLIAGGKDKDCDYTGLGKAILSVCDRIILLGDNKDKIKSILIEEADGVSYRVVEADDYAAALQLAKEHVKTDEIVILSPAGTSYDQFRHFEERGDLFCQLVLAL